MARQCSEAQCFAGNPALNRPPSSMMERWWMKVGQAVQTSCSCWAERVPKTLLILEDCASEAKIVPRPMLRLECPWVFGLGFIIHTIHVLVKRTPFCDAMGPQSLVAHQSAPRSLSISGNLGLSTIAPYLANSLKHRKTMQIHKSTTIAVISFWPLSWKG